MELILRFFFVQSAKEKKRLFVCFHYLKKYIYISPMERLRITAPARGSLGVASHLNGAASEKSDGANKKLNTFFGFPGGGSSRDSEQINDFNKSREERRSSPGKQT